MINRQNNACLIFTRGKVKTPSIIVDLGKIDYNFSSSYFLTISEGGMVNFASPGYMNTTCFCDAGKALCDHFNIKYDENEHNHIYGIRR